MPGISFVSWGGLASCAAGGFFYLIAWAKGREARQLEKALVIERLIDLKKLMDLLPLLVAVTGRVFADKPLECELSDTPAAVAQITEEQHSLKQVGAGDWVKDVQTVRSSTREVPWAIEEGSGGKGSGRLVRLPVMEARNASGDLAFVVSGDVFKEDERPLHRRAVDHLLGWKVLGMRRVERVLPVGAVVTAVGEVARVPDGPPAGEWRGALRSKSSGSSSGGSGTAASGGSGGGGDLVVLRQPKGRGGGPFIVSRRPLPEIVEGLDDASRACRYIAIGFGALGAVLTAVKLTRGTLAYMRQRRMRRRVLEAAKARAAQADEAASDPSSSAAAADALANDDEDDRAADLCVVCLEQECGSVFTQCGHMCACVSCAQKLNRCPICRARTSAIRVYRT